MKKGLHDTKGLFLFSNVVGFARFSSTEKNRVWENHEIYPRLKFAKDQHFQGYFTKKWERRRKPVKKMVNFLQHLRILLVIETVL